MFFKQRGIDFSSKSQLHAFVFALYMHSAGNFLLTFCGCLIKIRWEKTFFLPLKRTVFLHTALFHFAKGSRSRFKLYSCFHAINLLEPLSGYFLNTFETMLLKFDAIFAFDTS